MALRSRDYFEHTKHSNLLVCSLSSGKRLFQYLKGTEKILKAVRDSLREKRGDPLLFLSTVPKNRQIAGFLAHPNRLHWADVCFS